MNPGAQIGVAGWLSFGLSFVAILGAMGLLFFLMRRFAIGGKGRAAPKIQILESLALGPRQRIVLLRVNDHEILVGATQQKIVSLARWENADGLQIGHRDARLEPSIAVPKVPVVSRRSTIERTA